MAEGLPRHFIEPDLYYRGSTSKFNISSQRLVGITRINIVHGRSTERALNESGLG